jgi:hypothetical protein
LATVVKKDSIDVVKERQEARIILEENPNIAKDALEFILSLPVERLEKINR